MMKNAHLPVNRKKFSLSWIFAIALNGITWSQTCHNFDYRLVSEIPDQCGGLTMTALHDQEDRPYLYVAHKSEGLSIFDISNIEAPQLSSQVPIGDLGGVDVMSVFQSGNLLALALGSFFLNGQNSGIALLSIIEPSNPVVLDFWINEDPSEGAGGIVVDGDFAYLAAMGHGLIVFDISDPIRIEEISRLVPNVEYPQESPDLTKINARGIVLRDNFLYLTYDAGGLRIIDISDPAKPEEIGQYANPELLGFPRAYNNLVLAGNLAYVTVDYCGVEVLNVSDPGNITQIAWWNQWGCPQTNWFVSPGHTNEIALSNVQNSIFVSTGKSDMYVIDITDPENPDSCYVFGGLDNSIGTWGISVYKNNIFLAYICTLGIPFPSNWTGIKILEFDIGTPVLEPVKPLIHLFPNPSGNTLNLKLYQADHIVELSIWDLQGNLIRQFPKNEMSSLELDISDLAPGIYLLKVRGKTDLHLAKFVKY